MRKHSLLKLSNLSVPIMIPKHWQVLNLQRFSAGKQYSFTGGPFGSDLKSEEYTDQGVRILQLQNIGVGEFLGDYKIYTSEEKADQLHSCNIFPGDILIAKMADPVARACLIPQDHQRYLMASDGIRLESNKDLCSAKFLIYAINSSYVRYQAEIKSTGTTRLRIGLGALKKLKIITPPLQEQTQIAHYLDYKTAKIDSLIEKKQRLIELLEEERTAIINQAVTKGLDPDVPMKDSGIEWLGEIPEHWEVWKISHAFNNLGSGTTPESGNPKYHENGTINWLNTGDLNNGVLNGCSKKITQQALDDYSSLKTYPPGSLVIAMYGATIGKTAIINFETTTNQACCVFESSNVISIRFLQFWFAAKKEHIINLSVGGGQPNISQQILKGIRLPVPSYKEQSTIVDNLNKHEIQFGNLKRKVTKEIDLLKEYKTALISEVVTGKVDVKDEVIPE